MTFAPRARVPACQAVPTGSGLTWIAPRAHTVPCPRGGRPEGRGPGVGMHDREMDEVAIREVTAGRRRLATLTYAERHEAVRRLLDRRMTPESMARLVNTPVPTMSMYVRWVLYGAWISPNLPAATIETMLAEHRARHAA